MKLLATMLIFLILTPGIIGGRVDAKETVSWLVQDFPPSYILSGDFKGHGIVDEDLKYFLEHLPGFDNSIKIATVTRIWYQIAHTDGVCVASAFKTPDREKVARFSRASMVSFSPRLVVRKSRLKDFAPYLDAFGAIDLKRLGQNPALKGLYESNRSYGPAIDGFIADPARKAPLDTILTATQALTMLDTDRIDFTFANVTEPVFYRLSKNAPANFHMLEIAGQPALLYSYVACSKGPIGQQVILHVDNLLRASGWPPPYLSLGKRWYDPNEFSDLMAAPNVTP